MSSYKFCGSEGWEGWDAWYKEYQAREYAKSKALWDRRQAEAKAKKEAFSATTIPVADYYPQFCACCMKSKECVPGKCIKRLYDTDEPTRISPCYDFQPR
jgi:hypothetical protein